MNALRDDGIVSWSDVTADRLAFYISIMTDELLSDSTVARHVSAIHGFFRYMVESGELNEDVSEGLKAPKVSRHLPGILTDSEIDRLLKQPDVRFPKGRRDKAMLELMYATGLKAGEIVALHIDDLDFRVNCVDFRRRGEDRLIPFGRYARSAIMEYLVGGRLELLGDNEDEGVLFLSATGGRQMSRQGLWKIIKKYASLAGIKAEVTPYIIRHSFAARLLDNGADLGVVQEILGHTDIASTQWYAGNRHNYLREIYERTQPRK
jgi:integrase/recombinase XerD